MSAISPFPYHLKKLLPHALKLIGVCTALAIIIIISVVLVLVLVVVGAKFVT